jgi:DNA repair exonuclease SbcCD ATPase subunit
VSEYETPVGPLFDLQRESLKRGADILQTGRSVRNDLSLLGLQTAKALGTGALELGRRSLATPLALTEATTGIDTPRTLVDDTAATLQTRHRSAYETATKTYEQADTALVTREAEELAALIEASERTETQFAEAVAEFERTPARIEETTTELVDQLERLSDRIEAETERYAGNGDEGVRCRVCGDQFDGLTYAHLASHGLTVAEYQNEYGDGVPL